MLKRATDGAGPRNPEPENALVADRLLLVAQLLEATNGLLRDLAAQLRPTGQLSAADAPARSTPRQRRRTADVAKPDGNRPVARRRQQNRKAPGSSPRLHEEIAAVLREAGEPLSAREIAERVRGRGQYRRPRRTTPIDGTQISARVGHPQYRKLFTRADGRIALA